MDSRCTPSRSSWFSWLCSLLQSPLLLVIRLTWGLLFIVSGSGKLANMGNAIEFFGSLNIPAPIFFAWLVAVSEVVFGALVAIGLWTRLSAIPLIIITSTAYALDKPQTVLNIFMNFNGFMEQKPFTYLLAALILLSFGPGIFSLDAIAFYSRRVKNRPKPEDQNQ